VQHHRYRRDAETEAQAEDDRFPLLARRGAEGNFLGVHDVGEAFEDAEGRCGQSGGAANEKLCFDVAEAAAVVEGRGEDVVVWPEEDVGE